ncbi:hypothetical protein GCM10010466_11370 [Planomonospora alba]|uniref:CobQ/CobB/MinD/ParA nucleotide binding domain-containing protein n=1 Tax=Planomonospora alba TaxID=161354 RepID=A0ABP6MQ62_9ACTN
MARHDREESLEEQLAWLDAIKEQEEAPPAVVSAPVPAAVDDAVVSPYPQDPWSLVPSEPDAASSPLFRAAADPDHGSPAAPPSSTDGPVEGETADRPVEEADAADWAEAVEAVNSFTLPSARAPKDNDGFLTPLKPLPRQESDSGDLAPGTPTYALGGFGGQEREPSRGLFEEPARPEEPVGPSAEAPAEAPTPDTGRFGFGDSSDSGRFSFGGSSDSGGFGPGGPESDSGRFGVGGTDQEAKRPAPGGSESESGTRGFGPGTSESDSDRFSFGGSSGSGRFGFGTSESDSGRFSFGGTDPDADRFSGGDTDPGHGRFAVPAEQRLTPMEPFRPEAPGAFQAPESFGADRPDPAAPAERAPGAFPPAPPGQDASGGPTLFIRDREPAFGAGSDQASASGAVPAADRGPAFTPERDRTSESTQDTPVHAGADRGFTADRESAPFAADRGNAPEREWDEPVREPYQPRRRQSPPPPAFGSPARQQTSGTTRPSADSLDPDSLLRGRRKGPSGGWRKLVFKASAGLIKPGESPEVRRRRELLARARTPVATGHHRVAVLSLKGGVGKTTTTVGLGATLAQARGDRVIAVDANPDRGTLSDKLELETAATVRDLLNERAQIRRYVDIRAFTSQAPSRLEILASDRDPSVSEAFSAADYQAVAQVLENFYSICITDCGTGLLHSAMSGVLGLADQLVLVSSPSVDGARAASATLDWLEAHHYEGLVRAATVVLCNVRPRSKSTVDLDRLEAHFAARCRAVVRVPYDPHLEEGAEIDLDRLQPATRDAYLRLAASVGDGFAAPKS